jgi:hypothetical protein
VRPAEDVHQVRYAHPALATEPPASSARPRKLSIKVARTAALPAQHTSLASPPAVRTTTIAHHLQPARLRRPEATQLPLHRSFRGWKKPLLSLGSCSQAAGTWDQTLEVVVQLLRAGRDAGDGEGVGGRVGRVRTKLRSKAKVPIPSFRPCSPRFQRSRTTQCEQVHNDGTNERDYAKLQRDPRDSKDYLRPVRCLCSLRLKNWATSSGISYSPFGPTLSGIGGTAAKEGVS